MPQLNFIGYNQDPTHHGFVCVCTLSGTLLEVDTLFSIILGSN